MSLLIAIPLNGISMIIHLIPVCVTSNKSKPVTNNWKSGDQQPSNKTGKQLLDNETYSSRPRGQSYDGSKQNSQKSETSEIEGEGKANAWCGGTTSCGGLFD